MSGACPRTYLYHSGHLLRHAQTSSQLPPINMNQLGLPLTNYINLIIPAHAGGIGFIMLVYHQGPDAQESTTNIIPANRMIGTAQQIADIFIVQILRPQVEANLHYILVLDANCNPYL